MGPADLCFVHAEKNATRGAAVLFDHRMRLSSPDQLSIASKALSIERVIRKTQEDGSMDENAFVAGYKPFSGRPL